MRNLGMDLSILQVLPITEIDLLDVSHLKKLGLPNPSITTLQSYTTIPGSKIPVSSKEEEFRKRKYHISLIPVLFSFFFFFFYYRNISYYTVFSHSQRRKSFRKPKYSGIS